MKRSSYYYNVRTAILKNGFADLFERESFQEFFETRIEEHEQFRGGFRGQPTFVAGLVVMEFLFMQQIVEKGSVLLSEDDVALIEQSFEEQEEFKEKN